MLDEAFGLEERGNTVMFLFSLDYEDGTHEHGYFIGSFKHCLAFVLKNYHPETATDMAILSMEDMPND